MTVGYVGDRNLRRQTPLEAQTVDRRLEKLADLLSSIEDMRLSEAQCDKLAALIVRGQRLAISLVREALE